MTSGAQHAVRLHGAGAGPTVVDFPPGATFGPRRLTDFELVWVLAGSATCSIGTPGDRHELELVPGLLLLAQPEMTDLYRWRADAASRHAYVHFTLDAARSAGRHRWPLVRPFGPDDPLEALCRYLAWLPSAPARSSEAAVLDTIALVVRLFTDGPLPPGERTSARHVDDIVGWLGRRWRAAGVGPVAVAELADGVGLSAGHLSRICRAEWGLGPAELVEQLRLGRAASLLARSNLGVAQVARACGFVDPFHFSRRFRRCFGVPPRDYRAQPVAAAGALDEAVRGLAARVLTDTALSDG